jgi:hypothetical protein
LNIGGLSSGTILDDGRVQYADGRIRTPGGHWAQPAQADTAGGQPLYYNDQKEPVYATDSGIQFNGLRTDTRYPVPAMPDGLRPANGQATMSFDSTGQGFWNISGNLVAPSAPYRVPTLGELETGAVWNGARDSITSLPSAVVGAVSNGASTLYDFATGDSDTWNRASRFMSAASVGGAIDSTTAFIRDASPLSYFGAATDGKYYEIGGKASLGALGAALPILGTLGTDAVASIRNALSETNSANAAGRLNYLGNGTWQSPLGLEYGPDAQYGNRIQHVLRHAEDQPLRAGEHGVFDVGRSGVVGLIDEAWSIAQQGGPNVIKTSVGAKDVYTVGMGRNVGWVGGQGGTALGNPAVNNIQLVIRNGNQVITGFPIR